MYAFLKLYIIGQNKVSHLSKVNKKINEIFGFIIGINLIFYMEFLNKNIEKCFRILLCTVHSDNK